MEDGAPGIPLWALLRAALMGPLRPPGDGGTVAALSATGSCTETGPAPTVGYRRMLPPGGPTPHGGPGPGIDHLLVLCGACGPLNPRSLTLFGRGHHLCKRVVFSTVAGALPSGITSPVVHAASSSEGLPLSPASQHGPVPKGGYLLRDPRDLHPLHRNWPLHLGPGAWRHPRR